MGVGFRGYSGFISEILARQQQLRLRLRVQSSELDMPTLLVGGSRYMLPSCGTWLRSCSRLTHELSLNPSSIYSPNPYVCAYTAILRQPVHRFCELWPGQVSLCASSGRGNLMDKKDKTERVPVYIFRCMDCFCSINSDCKPSRTII